MRKCFLLSLCILVVFVPRGRAQSNIRDTIEKTFAQRIPIAIEPFKADQGTRGDNALAIERVVQSDLKFSGLFELRDWYARTGQSAVAEGLIEVRGRTTIHGSDTYFEGSVVDAQSGQVIGAKRYRLTPNQARAISHHFADEVVRMLTGEDGIAQTEVLFRREVDDKWEIVLADYDGHNPRVLLRQSMPAMYPRWIDANKAVTYTSFRQGKPDLFVRYLAEKESKTLANFEGLNYSVDWSDKRKEIVATLSKDGNPEIYIMSKQGEVKRRLTHSRAIETSPSWSPTGREIAFTSDRVGSPQIYVMENNGSNVRRLSFSGNYNDSPAWSPKGDLIAFVSRIDGFFQLCTIRPDGSDFTRLTDLAVNHEDPRWAPNGRHLVFSQEMGGEHIISIIDIGTGGKRELARGQTPDWSIR